METASRRWKRTLVSCAFLDRRITVRFRQNDNRFGTGGQDYKESIWEAGLTDRF